MLELRAPERGELQAATELSLRSKAFWGYDSAFMAACVAELTLSENDLAQTEIVLAVLDGAMAGVAQVSHCVAGCFLEKLFVDPPFMGRGIGRRLFQWSCAAASELGACEMVVEADPDAVPFYVAMGCVPAGTAASGSISGRKLPRLICRVGERPSHVTGTQR